MKETWRLINSPPGEAALNMAIDEAIATAVRQRLSPPTMRFYAWSPPAVSLGYFQKADEVVTLTDSGRPLLPVVRRITGGQALVHGEDLSFSVAVPLPHPLFPRTLRRSFTVIGEGLLRGLKRLGIEAEWSHQEKRDPSPMCLLSSSGHEIAVDGKKLIGICQKRWRDGLLVQGSILLECDPAFHLSVLRHPVDVSADDLLMQAVSLSTLLPCPVEENVRKAMSDPMTAEGELTPEEERLAARLVEEKYSRDGWNFNGGGRSSSGASEEGPSAVRSWRQSSP